MGAEPDANPDGQEKSHGHCANSSKPWNLHEPESHAGPPWQCANVVNASAHTEGLKKRAMKNSDSSVDIAGLLHFQEGCKKVVISGCVLDIDDDYASSRGKGRFDTLDQAPEVGE